VSVVARDATGQAEPGHHEPGHRPFGLDLEKKVLVASERDEAERRQWRDEVADLDAQQFVFVDESSTNITLTPRYGWAPHHERAVGQAPRNYPHNLTLVAALTPTGVLAPMTLPGALTGDAFVAYVAQVLVPTLQPGQIVIIDNLSCHKRAEVAALLRQVGCHLRYLPAYSPDFTPIEQAFSKLKQQLRRAQARTEEALEAAIAAALSTISASDARAWFHHVGYPLDDKPVGQPL
jgi:transposase